MYQALRDLRASCLRASRSSIPSRVRDPDVTPPPETRWLLDHEIAKEREGTKREVTGACRTRLCTKRFATVALRAFALRVLRSLRAFVIQNPDVTPPPETPHTTASGTDAPPDAGLRAAEHEDGRIAH